MSKAVRMDSAKTSPSLTAKSPLPTATRARNSTKQAGPFLSRTCSTSQVGNSFRSTLCAVGGSVIEEVDGKKVLRPYNPNEIPEPPSQEEQPAHSLVTASIMAAQEAKEKTKAKRSALDSASMAASSDISPSYQHVSVRQGVGENGEPLTFQPESLS